MPRTFLYAAVLSSLLSSVWVEAQENDSVPDDQPVPLVELIEQGATLSPSGRFNPDLTLSLKGEQFTDDSLERVGQLENVHSLVIEDTKITGAGLKHLASLTDLSTLVIKHTAVDDRHIESLIACESVEIYVLHGTRISDMGIQRMRSMLKTQGRGAEVAFQRGAFLGVTANALDGICVVTMVVPDSAAAEAGLQPGDIIIEYAKRPVPDFQALVSLVGESEIGETTTLVVNRSGERIKKKVTLKRRDESLY